MRDAVYHWGFSENYIFGACRPGNTQKAEDSRADLKSCGAAAFRNMVQGIADIMFLNAAVFFCVVCPHITKADKLMKL